MLPRFGQEQCSSFSLQCRNNYESHINQPPPKNSQSVTWRSQKWSFVRITIYFKSFHVYTSDVVSSIRRLISHIASPWLWPKMAHSAPTVVNVPLLGVFSNSLSTTLIDDVAQQLLKRVCEQEGQVLSRVFCWKWTAFSVTLVQINLLSGNSDLFMSK